MTLTSRKIVGTSTPQKGKETEPDPTEDRMDDPLGRVSRVEKK